MVQAWKEPGIAMYGVNHDIMPLGSGNVPTNTEKHVYIRMCRACHVALNWMCDRHRVSHT